MFGLNSLAYKLIGVTLGVIAVFGFGYYKGHSAVQVAFDQYKADAAATAKAQEEKAKQIEARQQRITEETRNAYNTRLAGLRAYYGLRLNQGGSAMPKANYPTSGIDGYSPDNLPPPAILASQCAETTLTLVSLQSWVKDMVAAAE